MFSPSGFTTPAAEVNLTIGGQYSVTMKSPDGKLIRHWGNYREILPPKKLVFTWILDKQGCDGGEEATGETLVTVEFRDLGGSTEIVLTHEFLPSEKSRDGHLWGWNECFNHLAQAL